MRLNVSPFAGDLSIGFSQPLTSGYCRGAIRKYADPEFTIEITDAPCGPITGAAGRLQLSGGRVTLTAAGLPDLVLHRT